MNFYVLQPTHGKLEIKQLRETKTQLIDPETGDRYKKTEGSAHLAELVVKYCGRAYVYTLDSRFAIEELGYDILAYPHPNKEAITKAVFTYNFNRNIADRIAREQNHNTELYDLIMHASANWLGVTDEVTNEINERITKSVAKH